MMTAEDVSSDLFLDSARVRMRKEYLEKVQSSLNTNEAIKEAALNKKQESEEKIMKTIQVSKSFELLHQFNNLYENTADVDGSLLFREETRRLDLKAGSRFGKHPSALNGALSAAYKKSQESLTKEEKKKLQEEAEKELEAKKKKAEEFAAKMKAEGKERKKKKQERSKVFFEKLNKEFQEERERTKGEKELLLKQRKDEALRKHEELKKKRAQDKQNYEEALARHSPTPEESYLYKKLEDKYNKEVLMPMLEFKKQQLALKRNQVKSVTRKELDEHMKRHEALISQRIVEKQNEQKSQREEERKLKASIDKLRIPILEKRYLDEQKQKEEQELKKQEKKELKHKMLEYAKVAQDVHRVAIDTSKAEEIRKNIEKTKSPPKVDRLQRKTISLTDRKMKTIKHEASKQLELNLTQKDEKPESTLKSKPTKKRPNKVIDPLEELKKKRGARYGIPSKDFYNWDNDLKDTNLNAKEKFAKVIEKANYIEKQAMRKEEVLKVTGSNTELGESVTDMYLDAIKAKLAILTDLN